MECYLKTQFSLSISVLGEEGMSLSTFCLKEANSTGRMYILNILPTNFNALFNLLDLGDFCMYMVYLENY